MTLIEALILGIVQGLTEFLPVSSSGHIELGRALLGVSGEDKLTFSLLVHTATSLSILIVFRKDILKLLKGALKFKLNTQTKYLGLLAVSMIPVGIVGLLFESEIEEIFRGRTGFTGLMLLVTALVLLLTRYAPKRTHRLHLYHAVLIGLVQAIAIFPGISRSGMTISMALLLGIKKGQAARFSFLMVLAPIMGASLLKIIEMSDAVTQPEKLAPLAVGFLAAFVSGLLACSWMVRLVKQGKIVYFSIYCVIVGLIAVISTFI